MDRIAFVAGIFLIALLFPWWVFVGATAIVSFRYRLFFEGVVIAGLYDILYATHTLFGIRFFVTALAVVVCFGVFFIRRYIRYDAFSS
ncbi:hypothetical protein IPJ70_01295 [Candidatus Campbellbacteria bacterium]|nr:MAG: hypothetical protein IPJ70_01295 [Candidatus Campbellbacteria bacterium]